MVEELEFDMLAEASKVNDKVLTLKSLEKQTRERFDAIEKEFEELKKQIAILKKSIRR